MGWRRRGTKKSLKKIKKIKKRRWRRKRGGDREEIEKGIVWRRSRGFSDKKEGLGGGRWEIIKKSEWKYYFSKKVNIIDKLMWLFVKLVV